MYYYDLENEKAYNMAEKYYYEGNYEKAKERLENMKFKINDSDRIYFKESQLLFSRINDKYKLFMIDKCIKALDIKDYDAAENYVKRFPEKSYYGTRFIWNVDFLDSINYSIGSRLLNEDNYTKSIRFFENIKNVKSKAKLLIPKIVIICNKAIENNDLRNASKSYNLITGYENYIDGIDQLKIRIENMKINETKRIVEEYDLKEKSKPQFEIGGLKIIVNSSGQWNDYDEFIAPKQGYSYYVLNVTILNISNEIKYINPFNFTLIDGEGYKYNISLFGKDPSLVSGNLSPNDKTRGYLTFEVLRGATDFKIQYNSMW
jgi:tetratricopeptide (TPR) repeat protein